MSLQQPAPRVQPWRKGQLSPPPPHPSPSAHYAGGTVPLTLCLPLGNLLICEACLSSYLFKRGQSRASPWSRAPKPTFPSILTVRSTARPQNPALDWSLPPQLVDSSEPRVLSRAPATTDAARAYFQRKGLLGAVAGCSRVPV